MTQGDALTSWGEAEGPPGEESAGGRRQSGGTGLQAGAGWSHRKLEREGRGLPRGLTGITPPTPALRPPASSLRVCSCCPELPGGRARSRQPPDPHADPHVYMLSEHDPDTVVCRASWGSPCGDKGRQEAGEGGGLAVSVAGRWWTEARRGGRVPAAGNRPVADGGLLRLLVLRIGWNVGPDTPSRWCRCSTDP